MDSTPQATEKSKFKNAGYGTKWFFADDQICDVLFRGKRGGPAARARARGFSEGAIEPFPGVMSIDDSYLHFLDVLSRRLNKAFPASTDDAGRVGANGVRANFNGLRHTAGFPMIPATWPLTDNTKKRSDAKLADGPTCKEHELIFRAVVRLFFSDLQNVGLKIAKGTSQGAPSFEKTMVSKLITARKALEDAEAAGNLILKGDYEAAFLAYDIGGATTVVYREQNADKIEMKDGKWEAKVRMVADFDYAATGGKSGKMIPASKDPQRLRDAGVRVPEGFFCTRRRTAMACPFTVNAVLMPIAQAVRHKIYDVYAYTTHHTTRANKQEKISGWSNVIASDVSDHDTLWPGWLLDLICDELETMGFASWWIAILKTGMRLPVYVTAPAPDEGRRLMGDWRHPDLNVGLPSGIGFTDLMGSLLMIPTYTILQLDHTAPELYARIKDLPSAMAFMHSYLQGREVIAQISKSDDAMLGWKGGLPALRSQDLLEAMKQGDTTLSPYMVVSYEHGGAFLGDVLVYDHTYELKNARFMGNIISYVNNMFVPETGIDSHQPHREKRSRPFPGLAVPAAPIVYGACPTYNEVNDIIEKTWFEVYGESFRAMRNRMYEEDSLALADWIQKRSSQTHLGELTAKDYEVLAEPGKLSWKFSVSEINPAVVEMLSSGLAPEETQAFFDSVIPK